MVLRDVLFVGALLGGAGVLGAGLLRPSAARINANAEKRPASSAATAESPPIVTKLNDAFRVQWGKQGISEAGRASELVVMRRLSLALTGSIPSLEEIRRFESNPIGKRIEPWLDEVLKDRRFGDYAAERLARAYVGTEDGPFLLFRRRRFTTWLSDAILANRPYDAIVRELISARGVWTDHPATNFLTVTFNPDTKRPDAERLAARVARAFLGVRIDCAQCHDHPFQPWKQRDFQGLAAFFGGVNSDLKGIQDGELDYAPEDRKTKKPLKIEPRVPFQTELRPTTGTPREQLAAWVTNPKNPHLARATANRVWALMTGRPMAEPVDDLSVAGEIPPALEMLAADFSEHGHDLHRLIRVIAATQVFRLDSAAADDSSGEAAEEAWAVFPMTRLRPEQVAGSLIQAARLSTLDAQSPWVVRFFNYTGSNDFVRRYGDTGEDEFNARGGTIPQRLLLLNGELVKSKSEEGLLNASSRIAELAPSDHKAVEVAFLTVLTRRPSPDETAHFEARLAGVKGNERKDRLTDLFWTLMNSTEFSWNH
jgi:Protein of unknown function (DUF1549)/Protein of unknown function (DUF1553)